MQEKPASQKSEVAHLLTAAEAGEYLGVNPATIRRWIKVGNLPAVKVGSVYRVSASDLDQMVRAA